MTSLVYRSFMDRRTALKAGAVVPLALGTGLALSGDEELTREWLVGLDVPTRNYWLRLFYRTKPQVKAFIDSLVKRTVKAYPLHRRAPGFPGSVDPHSLEVIAWSYWLYGEAFWSDCRHYSPDFVKPTSCGYFTEYKTGENLTVNALQRGLFKGRGQPILADPEVFPLLKGHDVVFDPQDHLILFLKVSPPSQVTRFILPRNYEFVS